jgi:hypothetical protein
LLACNIALYFTPVRCRVQVKQRLAGATTKQRCGLVDSQPWDFSFITSGLSVLLGHSWDRAHARSETDDVTFKVCLYIWEIDD